MRKGLWLALLPVLLGSAPAPEAPEPVALQVALSGLRSANGEVRVCVSGSARAFPGCKGGIGGVLVVAAAAHAGAITVPGLAPGRYAVSVQHDENANNKLDRSALGLPTEGVGFSNNPRITFGPPSFKASVVEVQAGSSAAIRMKYFL